MTAISIAVAAALGASCGSSKHTLAANGAKARTVSEASPRLKAMVDATAAAVARDFTVKPDQVFKTTGCNDANPGDTTVTAPYSLKFVVPEGTDLSALFARTHDYWQGHGYAVSTYDLTISDPRVFATRNGYRLSLETVPSQHMAYFNGSTPCLPDR